MMTTSFDMKNFKGKNPFETVKWTKATNAEKSKFYGLIAKVEEARAAV